MNFHIVGRVDLLNFHIVGRVDLLNFHIVLGSVIK
jgi:hypothetical protein